MNRVDYIRKKINMSNQNRGDIPKSKKLSSESSNVAQSGKEIIISTTHHNITGWWWQQAQKELAKKIKNFLGDLIGAREGFNEGKIIIEVRYLCDVCLNSGNSIAYAVDPQYSLRLNIYFGSTCWSVFKDGILSFTEGIVTLLKTKYDIGGLCFDDYSITPMTATPDSISFRSNPYRVSDIAPVPPSSQPIAWTVQIQYKGK